jgi:hypothetical protein
VERSFAHLYETGAMRRTHLRCHENIIKRLLIHGSAYNLGLIMRKTSGVGTPRGMQDSLRALKIALHILSALLGDMTTHGMNRAFWPAGNIHRHSNAQSISTFLS